MSVLGTIVSFGPCGSGSHSGVEVDVVKNEVLVKALVVGGVSVSTSLYSGMRSRTASV